MVPNKVKAGLQTARDRSTIHGAQRQHAGRALRLNPGETMRAPTPGRLRGGAKRRSAWRGQHRAQCQRNHAGEQHRHGKHDAEFAEQAAVVPPERDRRRPRPASAGCAMTAKNTSCAPSTRREWPHAFMRRRHDVFEHEDGVVDDQAVASTSAARFGCDRKAAR